MAKTGAKEQIQTLITSKRSLPFLSLYVYRISPLHLHLAGTSRVSKEGLVFVRIEYMKVNTKY